MFLRPNVRRTIRGAVLFILNILLLKTIINHITDKKRQSSFAPIVIT